MVNTCRDIIELDTTNVDSIIPVRGNIRRYHELVLGILKERSALDGNVAILTIEAANDLTVRFIGIGRINLHQQGILAIEHYLVVVARRNQDLWLTDFVSSEVAGCGNRVLGEDCAGNLIVDDGQFEEPHATGTASSVVRTHDVHQALLSFSIDGNRLSAIVEEVG